MAKQREQAAHAQHERFLKREEGYEPDLTPVAVTLVRPIEEFLDVGEDAA